MDIEYLSKMKLFPSFSILIAVEQWKIALCCFLFYFCLFIWKVNFIYLQLVTHTESEKRIWKVDLRYQVKFEC